MALVQKSVVNRCNLLGKPVVITRVLDTMATAPRPTRSTPFTTESGPSLSTTNSFGHFATVASYPSKLVLCSSCCHSSLHSNWSRWAAKSDLPRFFWSADFLIFCIKKCSMVLWSCCIPVCLDVQQVCKSNMALALFHTCTHLLLVVLSLLQLSQLSCTAGSRCTVPCRLRLFFFPSVFTACCVCDTLMGSPRHPLS